MPHQKEMKSGKVRRGLKKTRGSKGNETRKIISLDLSLLSSSFVFLLLGPVSNLPSKSSFIPPIFSCIILPKPFLYAWVYVRVMMSQYRVEGTPYSIAFSLDMFTFDTSRFWAAVVLDLLHMY